MAYISYDKLRRSEFHNNVSAKDRAQDINFNHLKVIINDSKKKMRKSNKFERPNDEDVIKKDTLTQYCSEWRVTHRSLKKSNDFKLHGQKLKSEEVLLERAVKTPTKNTV